ncbi:hypothetical protein L1B06_14845 (plasmid) [Listeria monocytogenes]|nr:hypothetical protein [Listeria monocytogenes]MCM8934090.1 hypothetical protein [Listeria monocytogenes]MCM9064266.1 hypothetical protein [Listeria monocytogenes]
MVAFGALIVAIMNSNKDK